VAAVLGVPADPDGWPAAAVPAVLPHPAKAVAVTIAVAIKNTGRFMISLPCAVRAAALSWYEDAPGWPVCAEGVNMTPCRDQVVSECAGPATVGVRT
jgi:hypothetical protein